jgi:hypothetical protein
MAVVRTLFDNGGYHIQFNVLDTEKLRDAQKHPENYRDLVVRVAGFSVRVYRTRSSSELCRGASKARHQQNRSGAAYRRAEPATFFEPIAGGLAKK